MTNYLEQYEVSYTALTPACFCKRCVLKELIYSYYVIIKLYDFRSCLLTPLFSI